MRFEQALDAKIAPLLRRVRCAQYPWSVRCWPLDAYAREQLGMSATKALCGIKWWALGGSNPGPMD